MTADSSPSGPPPEAAYFEMLAAYWRLLGVRAVADAALADHLKDGPLTADELAARAQAQPNAIYRIMRSMTNAGFFEEVAPRTFALTPVGQLLRSDVPNSFRSMILSEMGIERVAAWHNLPYSFRTGKVAWDDAYQGKDVWHWYRENPAQGEHFAKWMTQGSRVTGQAICKAFDFSAYPTIVDVGGGQGQFLTQILDAFPSCQGILFDQPQVVAGAPDVPRLKKVGGDFFEAVPAGADLYTLKWVIHDWDIPKSVAILGNVRKAMKPGAQLMLIEALVRKGPEADLAKWMDINMMTMTGGEERDESEYRELLDRAGFALERTIATDAFPWLLLAKPK